MNKYYQTFRTKGLPANELDKQLIHNLYKRPAKEKQYQPHYDTHIAEDNTHQADLLYLPNDDGYKYALVITDIGTGRVEAYPLKSRDANAVKQAFKAIYEDKKRGLGFPKLLQVDDGSEFKAECRIYLESHGVFIRHGKPGRSRQQAIVEKLNGDIAKSLFMRMTAEELLNNEQSTEWKEDLPVIIKALNEEREHEADTEHEYGDPEVNPNEELLAPGTKVRIQLDKPRELLGQKLSGKFRKSDIRWNPKIYTIETFHIIPEQPILYNVNELKYVRFTRPQLQVVNTEELLPPVSVLRKFKVETILKKAKKNGRVVYLVKWKNYDDSHNTWESRIKLLHDVPTLVHGFDHKN